MTCTHCVLHLSDPTQAYQSSKTWPTRLTRSYSPHTSPIASVGRSAQTGLQHPFSITGSGASSKLPIPKPPPYQQPHRLTSLPSSARQATSSSTHAPGQKPDHGLRATFPRVFGLVIGINDYTSTGHISLRGAEPDARQWRDFVKDLGVSGSQTTMLLGRSATRKAIVTALEALANNDNIEEGDPIIIFYAGHGGEVLHRTPDGEEHLIQMVVPSDYCMERGRVVHCISDLEIAALIDRIAEKKGDNITVIMDCCHSASGTRGPAVDHSDIRVRSVELPSAAYNPEFGRNPKPGTQSGQYSHAGLRSHMLLAACASTEQACEHRSKGVFSTALLDLFRKVPLNQLRYCDILRHMEPISSAYMQNPQCEGFNRNRFVFSVKAPPPSVNCYRIEFRVPGEDLILYAGSAHGITFGAQLTIYAQTDTQFKRALTTVTVRSLASFSAIMSYPPGFTLLQPSVAIQIKPGENEDLRLFIPRDDRFWDICKRIIDSELGSKFQLQNINLVGEDQSTDAHLQASMGDTDEVTFKMTHRRITRYGFHKRFNTVGTIRLTEEVPHHDVAWVLGRIAHYFRNLNHRNDRPNFTREIEIGFYELNDTNKSDWRKFTPEGPNLYHEGAINFEVKKGVPYGVRLVNRSAHDLYPYLFVFVSHDLSIGSIYQIPGLCSTGHAAGSTVESPLKAGESLALGYGSGGVPPCQYKIRGRRDGDVDFLKIVLATRPIDISTIAQLSPFQTTRAPFRYIARFPDSGGWDSILIPIVQRRARRHDLGTDSGAPTIHQQPAR